MSLTIVELIWRLEGQIFHLVITDQSILLPEPAIKGIHRWLSSGKEKKEHTFSVNPQKRTRGFPFLENATLEEPPRCPLVVNVTGHVVVGG